MGSMKNERGFSLLELMVVLAVASIILTVGVPSFRAAVLDARMVSETNEFVSSVNLARAAAVQYQRNAVICTTADFSAAVPTCSGASDWTNGWIVWVDKDRDAAVDANEVLAVQEPLSDTTTFSGGNDRFTYDARGFGLAGADTLTVCDNRSNETGRRVRVNAAGRTSVAQLTCS